MPNSPAKVVLICGSSRFEEQLHQAAQSESAAGNIVVTLGKHAGSIWVTQGEITSEIKSRLAGLWRQLIDAADEILVVNVDGYIGESTKSEIQYATEKGKTIRYSELTP